MHWQRQRRRRRRQRQRQRQRQRTPTPLSPTRTPTPVALNISEGSGSQGKNRNARYFNALGSAKEVSATLDVACAFGYVGDIDAELARKLDQIRATLWRVVHG